MSASESVELERVEMAELIGGPAAVGRRGETGVTGASVGPPGLDAIDPLRDVGRRGRALFGKPDTGAAGDARSPVGRRALD